jgi:hemolysin activation/secretion protein
LRDNLAAFGLYDRQSLYVADASLSYEGRDNFLFGGFSTASVKLSVARLNIDSVTDRLLDNIAEGGRDTLGNSVRMTVSANRLVPLAGNNTQSALFAGVSAQWANRNLDNASRITLGGPQGVRAYAPSEAVVDAGGVGTIEYRVGLSRWVAAVLPSRYSGFASNVTGAVFFDYGIGRYNIHATPAQTRGQSASTVVRSGAGVGLTWSLAPKITINTTVAWRTTGTDSTGNDRVPRFYAQFTKVF